MEILELKLDLGNTITFYCLRMQNDESTKENNTKRKQKTKQTKKKRLSAIFRNFG